MAANASEQGGARPPPLSLGHAGLVHRGPAEGLPADLVGGSDNFAPGSAVAFLSADSEAAFLRAAISLQPPSRQSHMAQLTPQPAACLEPEAALQLQHSLGQPSVFTAGRLFDRRSVWLSELDPPAYVRRWLTDGYSEYLPRPVSFVQRQNNSSTQQHIPFVTEQVHELHTIGAVEDITALQHDRAQCAAILPLTAAVPDNLQELLAVPINTITA